MHPTDRKASLHYSANTILLLSLCGCSANLDAPLARERQTLEQSSDAGEPGPGACPTTPSSSAIDGSTENADITPNALASVRLNELVIDPPGADGNNEFIEIMGQPCANLAGLYLAAIEGDSESNPGTVDRILNFQTLCGSQPCQLGPSGALVVTATNGWQKPTDSSATWVFSNALVGGGLENGTTTLILLECTVAPSAGGDWDPGDTGILQIPSACRPSDSLTLLDRAVGDFAYAATKIGPKPSPQGSVRCTGPDAAPWWYYGALSSDLQGITFTGTLSIASKIEAALTPGMPNDCTTMNPAGDAAAVLDAGDPAVSDVHNEKTVDAAADVNSQAANVDAGQHSTISADAASSPILSGSSKWWEPDSIGIWPDSGPTFDASTLNGPGDSTASKGAPSIPEASCSLAVNRRSGGFGSGSSTVIGTLLWFMLRRRRVE